MTTRNLRPWMLLSLLLLALQAMAQKPLELKDSILNPNLYPKGLRQLQWLPDGSAYSYAQGDSLLAKDMKGKERLLLSTQLLQQSHEGLKELKALPALAWADAQHLDFEQQGAMYRYDLASGKSELLLGAVKDAENADRSPDKRMLAFTRGNNLFLATAQGERALTQETDKGIVSGAANVHRNEFGISKGTFWAPNNQKLAFYRMDERMVTDYPLVDIGTVPAALKSVKYPMAGQKSHEVKVGVYDIASGKTVLLQTEGPAEQYLTNVAFSPNGQQVYVAVLNREQNHLRFQSFDAQSGKLLGTLFEEKSDKYVHPEHAMTWLPGSNTDFLWQSERDGHSHLYHYNTQKGLLRQLTSGDWDVTEVLDFAGKDRLYAMGTANRGMDRQLYAIDLKKGGARKVSPHAGVYTLAKANPAGGKQLLTAYNNLTTPYVAELIDAQGKVLQSLHKADNPLKGMAISPVELLSLKAADDSTVLNARMIKPLDFDPAKRYPVMVYVYGGPNVQLIRNSWQADTPMWMQWMAQKGYLIFTVDSRGSKYRGRDFEQVTHRNLGEVEVADQLKGVEYLKSLPYVDAQRMGVHGWSYGGFMTTSLMLKTPGVFKAGVSGGGVMDWKFYEIMYTERYMGTPQNNPEGYAKATLLDKLGRLQGKLLLIHDSGDDVVVPQHAETMLRNAVQQGVQLDYFYYPGHGHNVRGKDRVHLIQQVADYFDNHVK